MENQFVPYELAVKLKELGFDDKVFANYLKGDFGYIDISNRFFGEKLEDIVKAPLWQQAFDWFRDKGFDLWVSRSFNCFNINIVEYDVDEDRSNDVTDGLSFKDFTSHEQARLACLEKLIELVTVK